jgi:hypothetical protein
MNFFSVPKVTVYHEDTGKDEVLEIRMVYNGTSCGLNPVLWAPWFALPTGEQMIRTLDLGYWGADNDYGDMFLNFWLHDDLQQYCGVDLTALSLRSLWALGKKHCGKNGLGPQWGCGLPPTRQCKAPWWPSALPWATPLMKVMCTNGLGWM